MKLKKIQELFVSLSIFFFLFEKKIFAKAYLIRSLKKRERPYSMADKACINKKQNVYNLGDMSRQVR